LLFSGKGLRRENKASGLFDPRVKSQKMVIFLTLVVILAACRRFQRNAAFEDFPQVLMTSKPKRADENQSAACDFPRLQKCKDYRMPFI
jgi:hypothetical protein